MYVFVLDEKGVRQTSYVVGVHADTLEETEKLARQAYPTANILTGDSEMQSQFISGKVYVNSEFVDIPVAEYVPTKEDKINAIKAEYEPRFKVLEEAQRRLLLMGKPTTAISAQYIKLNDEMVTRIKGVR